MKRDKFKVVEVTNDFKTDFIPYYMVMVRNLFGYWKPLKVPTVYSSRGVTNIDHSIRKYKVATFDKVFALTVKEWLLNNNKNKIFWCYGEYISKINPSIYNGMHDGGYVFGRKYRQDYLFFGEFNDYIVNSDVNFFDQSLSLEISEYLPEDKEIESKCTLNLPCEGIYNDQLCICHKVLTIGDEEVAFITREVPDRINRYFLNNDDKIKYGLENINDIEVIPFNEIFIRNLNSIRK